MQEWPLKSSLDPKIYGLELQKSAITKDIIEKELGAMISVEEVSTLIIHPILCLYQSLRKIIYVQ